MTSVGDEAGDASNKRQRTSGPEEPPAQTTVVDTASAFVRFTVNYKQNKYLAGGKFVHSDAISTGGHTWRINLYPNGMREHEANSANLCIALELLSKPGSFDAIFEVLLDDEDDGPDVTLIAAKRTCLYPMFYGSIVSFRSEGAIDLVMTKLVKGDVIKFLCTIRVLHSDRSFTVPPSDFVRHLDTLMDTPDGKDVSFTIDGETFHAHRAVLAARSPVFKTKLHGSMAEAIMPSITLHDIAPATFKVMLRFMYTDTLPGDECLGEVMVEHLLAAADRYALGHLKLLCTQKLWDNVSADNIASTLACAETCSCPELKDKCIGFFAEEKNFKKAVLTEGFASLVHQFPSIIAELRDGLGA